jgi:hypothetical protein
MSRFKMPWVPDATSLPPAGQIDPDYSIAESHTIHISDLISLRVYRDTQPRILKIANLQKGLIIVYEENELVGEGTGFGLPVLVCSDQTYFSGSSTIRVAQQDDRWIIRKEFIMDRTARNRFRNVTLENRLARDLIAYLPRLYQMHPKLRFLRLKGVTQRIDISTSFLQIKPIGKVTVTYAVEKQRISISADFKDLERDKLEKMFMLNEQGSRFFRKYSDSQGTKLEDSKIGAWDGIRAEWASLKLPDNKVGFRLWKKKNSILRRGREYLKGSLDWVGLDYELSPETLIFEYPVEILGA